MAVRRLRDLPKDLDKKISRDFNNLIKDVHNEVIRRTKICQYGQDFLLLAGKHQILLFKLHMKVEDFQPWAWYKRERSLD